MPWTSKGYDQEYYSAKMKAFELRGIPMLILLKKDGKSACAKDCRADVSNPDLTPAKCLEKWTKAVNEA